MKTSICPECIRIRISVRKKTPGVSQLVEQVADPCGAHLAVVGMVQITMDAALVVATGDVQPYAEGHS